MVLEVSQEHVIPEHGPGGELALFLLVIQVIHKVETLVLQVVQQSQILHFVQDLEKFVEVLQQMTIVEVQELFQAVELVQLDKLVIAGFVLLLKHKFVVTEAVQEQKHVQRVKEIVEHVLH